eukprot:329259-Chlamydomonas_euryale.AAC.4
MMSRAGAAHTFWALVAAFALAAAAAQAQSVGQPGTTLTTPVGNIGPLSFDIRTQLGVATTVTTIKDGLSAGDYGAAQLAYNNNAYLNVSCVLGLEGDGLQMANSSLCIQPKWSAHLGRSATMQLTSLHSTKCAARMLP